MNLGWLHIAAFAIVIAGWLLFAALFLDYARRVPAIVPWRFGR